MIRTASSASAPVVKPEPEDENSLLYLIEPRQLPVIKSEHEFPSASGEAQSNRTDGIKEENRHTEHDSRVTIKQELHVTNDMPMDSGRFGEDTHADASPNVNVPAWRQKQRSSRNNLQNKVRSNSMPNQFPQYRRRADRWRSPPRSRERSNPPAPPFIPRDQAYSSSTAQSTPVTTPSLAFPLASASSPYFQATPMFLVPATTINQELGVQTNSQ